ncbi:hypothetical protein [Streptomyces sp. NBC_00096]|uniref:hypothetical protein n=1 Tax=Streptomyces sp. NBC_00096 TaxID=2975650 RepID=UPI00324B423B
MTDRHPYPRELTWSDVDPARHPFTWDDGEEAAVTAHLSPLVPPPDADWQLRSRFADGAGEYLSSRYGPWAYGWNWSMGEGDWDGGVVWSWCCGSHSLRESQEVPGKVVAALLEWRGWLEDLAERFGYLAPPEGATPEERSWHLERATVRLVTMVADRTQTESGWYTHCAQVLGWFLSSTGLGPDQAAALVQQAIGGRFESWTSPRRTVIEAVGEDLAVRLTGEPPYRDR